MKNCIFIGTMLIGALCGYADEYQGKAIYHPEELKDMDFTDPESQWSLSRMSSTENVALFWAPGFGDNITTAPDLEGHNMRVDLANLLASMERFYRFFSDELGWVKPGSKAERYKMMAMLDYSLEGTAYGGAYDDVIGALWISPNRVQDERLNCIAHELGHSFQTQITCDGEGVAWGGAGIFEMASQWMLWQVNPDWQADEYYHLEAFRNLTHKAFLHIDNIYHSPYVLEYWSERHGLPFIAEMFRQGREDEDPVMTYQRMTGVSQEEFNDEMFDAQIRMVNWDYPRVWDNTRRYACQGWGTRMVKQGDRYMPDPANCPENYGFNVIELLPDRPGGGASSPRQFTDKISVDFRGLPGAPGYYAKNTAQAGWRYGIVAVDRDGKAHYTPVGKSKRGRIEYTPTADTDRVFLVVMGAPTEHWRNIDGEDNPGDAQWPYSIRLRGATPAQ